MRASIVLALVLAGCGSSAPESPISAPRPAQNEAPSEPSADPGPAEPACLVPVVRVAQGSQRLEAILVNRTDQELVIEAIDRCPNGVAIYDGVPADVDIYASCTMGACVGARPPRRFVVPAGGEVEVASPTLDGRPPCQSNLVAGRYTITFRLPGATGAALCAPVAGEVIVP